MSSETAAAKVIIAEFTIKPGALDSFLDVAEEHARITLANEPGCRQFDIARQDETHVVLYEVYDDDIAFAHHRAQTQLQRFRAATSNMIEQRNVREFSRIADGRTSSRGKVLAATYCLKDRQHLLEPLAAAGFDVIFSDADRAMTEAELIARLPGVVATIAGSEPYNARTLAAARDLKVVARLGVGYDQVDIAAATRSGVAIAMAFGTNHDAVADHAFALMAAASHRVLDYNHQIRNGGWGPLFHQNLSDSTVGIIGFGRIGRALAKRCKGFNMRVLATDPAMDAATPARLGCELVPLDELLGRSDFVSVHAPLDATTSNLINAATLASMKPTAYLINTARGGLVDEPALISALNNGVIAGAGLDVFAAEPLTNSPFLAMDNVVLSSHIAGMSEEAVGSMTQRSIDNILTVLDGRDPGGGLLLNPEVLSTNS